MVGTEFIDFIAKFNVATYAGLEDFGDKFSFLYSVVLLLLCTVIITAKSYLLQPISCYISTPHGGENIKEYVENYCWVQGTIPIAFNDSFPQTDKEWASREADKIRE